MAFTICFLVLLMIFFLLSFYLLATSIDTENIKSFKNALRFVGIMVCAICVSIDIYILRWVIWFALL